MKILITGGTGQLGSECARVFAGKHQVWAPGSHDLDITGHRAVTQALSRFAPDAVVNCAAVTNVDACETDRERAWLVNVVGPHILAAACRKRGCLLVHLSTNYLFDGAKPIPEGYAEDDRPAPISYYGMTKLESERAVAAETDEHVIVRTAWLYGIRGQNFLKKILSRIAAGPEEDIPVVQDLWGSPTWSYRLAVQMERLMTSPHRGIFHATSAGVCTWYELACFFLDRMGVAHRIAPCSRSRYAATAARPLNGILENRRLKTCGLHVMPSWQDDVSEFAQRFRQELLREAGLTAP